MDPPPLLPGAKSELLLTIFPSKGSQRSLHQDFHPCVTAALEPGEFQSCSLRPLLFIALPAEAPAGRRARLSQPGGPTPAAFLEVSEPTPAARCGRPGESPSGNAAQSSARSRSRCSPAAQWLPRGQAERVRVCGRARVCGARGCGGARLLEGLEAAPAGTDSRGAARAAPHTKPLASPLTPTPPTPLSSHPPPLGPFQAL